jgi:hypothetical protein
VAHPVVVVDDKSGTPLAPVTAPPHFFGTWGQRKPMTAVYLLVLAIFAYDHHSHWSQLHPWTIWFVILVIVAIGDLVVHRRAF